MLPTALIRLRIRTSSRTPRTPDPISRVETGTETIASALRHAVVRQPELPGVERDGVRQGGTHGEVAGGDRHDDDRPPRFNSPRDTTSTGRLPDSVSAT